MINLDFETNWSKIFNRFKQDQDFINLINQVNDLYLTQKIFPKQEDIFRCFNFFNVEDTKVVIVGQDPYYKVHQANGLAFSINKEVKISKSLVNIFKELKNDLGINRINTDLSDWAQQGVLLMNSIMTVTENKPLSHKCLNWEKYTDYIIKYLSDHIGHIVFILWGTDANKKRKLVNEKNNLVISSSHPSPLSAYHSFFNSKPFSRTNNYLNLVKKNKINW